MLLFVSWCVSGWSVDQNAELIDLQNGFIYDTDQDITWMKDSCYIMTSGYDDGSVTFYEALAWINHLNSMDEGKGYGGYNNWRLPHTPEIINAEAGEMYHLYHYYNVINNSSIYPFTSPYPNNTIGTKWYDTNNPEQPGTAWLFSFWDGKQYWTSKGVRMGVWAVHDGGFPGLIDSDSDGVIDIWDECPNTEFNVAVYSDGCKADDLYTEIENLMANIAQKDAEIAALQATINDLTQSLQSTFTDPQFSIPGENAQEKIDNLVDAIKNLNYGQQQALYENLGGTIGKGKKK